MSDIEQKVVVLKRLKKDEKYLVCAVLVHEDVFGDLKGLIEGFHYFNEDGEPLTKEEVQRMKSGKKSKTLNIHVNESVSSSERVS